MNLMNLVSNYAVIILNDDGVTSLCEFIIDREIPQIKKGFDLEFSVDYEMDVWTDIPMEGDTFSFGWNDGEDVIKTHIQAPGVFRSYDSFCYDLYFYLKDNLNFNLMDYAKEIEVTFDESVILFSILHELSHMKQYINEFNECEKFKSALAEMEIRNEINYSMNEDERFIAYRKLGTEMYADSNAVILMKKYKRIMKYWSERIVEIL